MPPTPPRDQPAPDWKLALADPVEPAGAAASPNPAYLRQLSGPVIPMGLQFELREQTPRTNERWRGPTARAVTSIRPGHGHFRLGVRPVIQNANGNWVRADLTWNNITVKLNHYRLNPGQHRWLCELLAVHRAVRGVYSSQESDWLYLDDFTSPLLWNLFGECAALGVRLVGSKKGASVSVGGQATVSLDAAGGGTGADLRLTTVLTIDGRRHPPEFAGTIGTHGVYGYELEPNPVFVLARTAGPLSPGQRGLLGRPSALLVPAHERDEFMAEFYPRLRHAVPVTSLDASVRFPEIAPPTLVLTARFLPHHTLQLDWDWEHHEAAVPTRLPLHPGDEGRQPAAAEREVLDRAARAMPAELRPAPPHVLQPRVSLKGTDAAEFTERVLPGLGRLPGVRVDVIGRQPEYRELTETPRLKITTVETTQRDWFDLGVIVTVAGKSVPFGPLFKALSKGQPKLLLIDNSYLSLRQPEFDRLRELIEEARSLQEWDTGVRISRYQAGLWADFEDLAEETEQAQAWRSAVSGLLDLTRIEATPLPAGVRATLRPYQLDGFAWLAFLWQHRLGGVLADDMGLGKTLQTLALLVHATAQPHDGAARRPFLIVAPTSVVSNWLSEARRFTPGLVVHGVTSTQAKGGALLADVAAGVDVVVTSYALFRLDFDAYQAHGWAGLVLDEAQFVKNRTARVHVCARELDTSFKLALTGTPMENSLMDLWSLFAIVAPGLFPSARKFTEDYVRPIEQGENARLLARLRRRIRPLLMRRTKELVASDLPKKQEQVLRIDLEPRHRKLYDTFLQRERQKLLGLIEDLDKNRFIVFRSLTLLRMLSLDASLVDEKYAALPSSKLDALLEQLEDVVAEGHRALIFSQFTTFLRKAADRLDAQGIPYCYLDGSTVRRSEVIDEFKGGAAPVFLISLKAGGFGLNLTEADYVFLLDPWWNPATEAQAVDRTHRIGQTRNVMVYRMVAAGTIEEKVMALKARKARLFSAVMDDDDAFSAALTPDDIRALLAP